MIRKAIKKNAKECNNIDEIREQIDLIDYEILKAIASRQDFVKEVVKYKKPDKESIVAKERYLAVLAKRREWAVELGLDADIIEEIYTKLMNHFIQKEMNLIEKQHKN